MINEIRPVFKNWNVKINKMYPTWNIFKYNLSGLFFFDANHFVDIFLIYELLHYFKNKYTCMFSTSY